MYQNQSLGRCRSTKLEYSRLAITGTYLRSDGSIPLMRRVLTLVGIVVAHLIAVYFLDRTLRKGSLTLGQAVTPMVIYFIERRRPAPEIEPAPERTRRTFETVPPKAVQPETARPIEPESNAITDWYGEAEAAVGAVQEREKARAALRSFKHEFAEPPPPTKPGVFGSEARNKRAGTVENGGTRFWVTDNCYFDFDRSPPPAHLAADVRMKTRTCKPPPTGGGSHMFDELAPSYLRRDVPAEATK
jgi:hypothetical protein